MPSILRIGPKVALFGVVAGLILVGWAVRYSLAQIPAQDPPPASELAPGSTVKGDVPQAAVVQTKPATDSELAAPIPPPGPADSLTIPQLKAEPSPSPFNAKTTDKSPRPFPWRRATPLAKQMTLKRSHPRFSRKTRRSPKRTSKHYETKPRS